MAITIQKIYDKIRSFDVKLLAGDTGMNRSARWYHMVESLEISTFLTGNEIVFITGVALKNQKELIEIVRSAHSRHACALVINLGPYIESVPDAVTDFCNSNAFPLFIVPWHIHMADIMRLISTMLSESESFTDTSELSQALTNAVLSPKDENSYRPKLNELGFGINNILQVAFTPSVNEGTLPPAPHGCSTTKLNLKGKNAFVLCGFNRTQLKKYMNLCFQKAVPLYVGASVDSVTLIYKSYENAQTLFGFRSAFPEHEKGIIFEETGIFGLIISVGDPQITKIFYEESLGILRRYDSNSKSTCCDALKAYLMNNSSIKDAAEETGLHKNTLLNRLHKVEELLNGDLSDLMFKCRLITAFIAEDLINIQAKNPDA